MVQKNMKANNYEVAEAGETITFRGLVARSTSQAFFLTFCTALGMASLALVLQIQFQDLGKCKRKEVLLLCCVLYDIWFIMTTCQCPQKSSSQLNQKSNISQSFQALALPTGFTYAFYHHMRVYITGGQGIVSMI